LLASKRAGRARSDRVTQAQDQARVQSWDEGATILFLYPALGPRRIADFGRELGGGDGDEAFEVVAAVDEIVEVLQAGMELFPDAVVPVGRDAVGVAVVADLGEDAFVIADAGAVMQAQVGREEDGLGLAAGAKIFPPAGGAVPLDLPVVEEVEAAAQEDERAVAVAGLDNAIIPAAEISPARDAVAGPLRALDFGPAFLQDIERPDFVGVDDEVVVSLGIERDGGVAQAGLAVDAGEVGRVALDDEPQLVTGVGRGEERVEAAVGWDGRADQVAVVLAGHADGIDDGVDRADAGLDERFLLEEKQHGGETHGAATVERIVAGDEREAEADERAERQQNLVPPRQGNQDGPHVVRRKREAEGPHRPA
jgi:hypothetical protein